VYRATPLNRFPGNPADPREKNKSSREPSHDEGETVEKPGDARESVLRDAVMMELQGKDLFERASEIMHHPRAREMFAGLAKQELAHAEILTEQLTGMRRGTPLRALEEMRDHPAHFDLQEVFGDIQTVKVELDDGAGELEVIRLGMQLEKKSIDYYESAASGSEDPDAKRTFEWLAGEEKGHLVILKAEHDNRAGSGFYYDTPEFSLEVR
jgi:rubrerythrin